MSRRSRFIAVVIGLTFLPQVASANAGTPLMWAGLLHLTFGNALIGVGEGLLIAWVFRRPKLRCVGWMIAANYLSAWLGGIGMAGVVASKLDWNLYNTWRLFWLFVAATYLVTLVLEWPLVALCFWRQEGWLRQSIKASLLAQTVSYICLFGWYWGASGKSLYTQMQIAPASEIRLPSDLRLFYIADAGGHICEQGGWISDVVSTNRDDRLLLTPIPGVTNAWALVLRLDADRDENVRLLPIKPTIQAAAAAVAPEEAQPTAGRHTRFNFGPALRVGNGLTNTWSFHTGFWPVEGMRAKNNLTGETFRFAWETPFSQWEIRNAIQLPDDHVIFQLGSSQICVLEPQTKRIALLVRGRGPAVLLK